MTHNVKAKRFTMTRRLLAAIVLAGLAFFGTVVAQACLAYAHTGGSHAVCDTDHCELHLESHPTCAPTHFALHIKGILPAAGDGADALPVSASQILPRKNTSPSYTFAALEQHRQLTYLLTLRLRN